MRHLKIMLLSVLLMTANLQCKDVLCKVLNLCDLASNIILPVSGILLGTNLGVVNEVLNIIEDSVDCTEEADPSESDFDVEYRANASSPWQIIPVASDKVIQVGSIVAGQREKDQLTYLFNLAGQYRFLTNADYNTKVEERSEGNNGYTTGKGVHPNGNNFAVSEILTVYPNPDIPYDPTKPAVELIGIKKIK